METLLAAKASQLLIFKSSKVATYRNTSYINGNGHLHKTHLYILTFLWRQLASFCTCCLGNTISHTHSTVFMLLVGISIFKPLPFSLQLSGAWDIPSISITDAQLIQGRDRVMCLQVGSKIKSWFILVQLQRRIKVVWESILICWTDSKL